MLCPDPERLKAYLEARATPEEAAHIERCPICLQALEQLERPADDLESAVRSAAAEPDYSPEENRLGGTVGQPPPAGSSDAHPTAPPTPMRYVPVRLLAQGGMGQVWEALDEQLGRPVALKRPRLDRIPRAAADTWYQRFKREVGIAARLGNHPHIVCVYDAGTEDSGPFLVTELLKGDTLKEVVETHGPLSVADACEALRQTAEALAFAHDQGVVHRDIKPGNLFLTRDGRIKVLDWGLAKVRGTDDLTRPGEVWLSKGFAPPEQESNFRAVDGRADLYALGATLVYLLTGRPPAGDPIDLPADVPPALADLLRRLLDREPHQRPASAREVAEALARHARGADLKGLLGEPRLHATLDVVWWDAAVNRWRSLAEPGALPMPTNTRLRIESHLNRPAYAYVFWIDTQGQLCPMHGWTGEGWRSLPALEPASSVKLPPDDPVKGPQWIPLEGTAGTKTVVLLARPTPLDRPLGELFPGMGGTLEQRLRAAMQQLPADPARSYEFTCRETEFAGGVRGPGKPVPASNDPLALVQLLLRDGLGPHFTLVRAVSFANRGR
jgi:serine/threonine protein kinase